MSDLIKIAFLMQETKMGGIEYNSIHLAGALNPQEFKVAFLCPGEGKLTGELRRKNLESLLYQRPPFFSTSIKIGRKFIFNPASTLWNFFTFPYLSIQLALLLHREKFDLVVTKGLLANFYGSLAACLSGKKCVWDMQEIVSGEKCFGFLRWILNLWAFLFVKGIIVPAQAVRNQFWSINQKKAELIPNGIDTGYYSPNVDPKPVRNEWAVKDDEILIGHIARFTHWKGQKDFVRASIQIAQEFPKAKFVLVGSPVFEDDAYEKEVRQMASESKFADRFLFPGFRNDLANVMAALEIFVHSSTEPEGCPITLIAAMSMSKPVIATHVDGNNEIINKPDQALLIPPSSPRILADNLLKLIRDRQFALALGTQARQRILDRYSMKSYSQSSGEVFKRIYA